MNPSPPMDKFSTAAGSSLGTPPDRATRLLAGLIDGGIALTLSVLFSGAPMLGALLGAAYLVGRDGVEAGPLRFRSVGKYVMGLGLRRLDGRPMDLETSLRRNWMFGLGALAGVLVVLPVIGGLLAPVVSLTGFALILMEIYNVYTDPGGQRWGDALGSTQVVTAGTGMI